MLRVHLLGFICHTIRDSIQVTKNDCASINNVEVSNIKYLASSSPYFFDANEKTTFIDTYVKAKFRTLNHFPG